MPAYRLAEFPTGMASDRPAANLADARLVLGMADIGSHRIGEVISNPFFWGLLTRAGRLRWRQLPRRTHCFHWPPAGESAGGGTFDRGGLDMAGRV